MNDTLRGALRSKTIWLNVALAVFGALAAASPQLIELLGPKWTAGILLVAGVANMVLRYLTTVPLDQK